MHLNIVKSWVYLPLNTAFKLNSALDIFNTQLLACLISNDGICKGKITLEQIWQKVKK